MADHTKIDEFLQSELARRGRGDVGAVEAARWLEAARLLLDSPDRPGLPLRRLLRQGRLRGWHRDTSRLWVLDRGTADSVATEARRLRSATRVVDRSNITSGNLQQLREQYRPADMRLLLVGESPPRNGTFFYHANSTLYRHVRIGFALAYGDQIPDRKAFLRWFAGLGCYVDDVCLEPVNHLSNAERGRACAAGVEGLAGRLREYRADRVVPVLKSIEGAVRQAAVQAGCTPSLLQALPFPRQQHATRFSRELAETLRQLREAGTLRPGLP